MIYYIAAWAALTGIFHIAAGIQLRRIIRNEWVMILSGFLGIIFSFWVIIFPEQDAVGLVWLIGAYSVIFGIFITIIAFSLCGTQREA